MVGSLPSGLCHDAGRATSTSPSETWRGRRSDEGTWSLPTVEATSESMSSLIFISAQNLAREKRLAVTTPALLACCTLQQRTP